jgi:hypothetical protein
MAFGSAAAGPLSLILAEGDVMTQVAIGLAIVAIFLALIGGAAVAAVLGVGSMTPSAMDSAGGQTAPCPRASPPQADHTPADSNTRTR